jgi:hypothetical protein
MAVKARQAAVSKRWAGSALWLIERADRNVHKTRPQVARRSSRKILAWGLLRAGKL